MGNHRIGNPEQRMQSVTPTSPGFVVECFSLQGRAGLWMTTAFEQPTYVSPTFPRDVHGFSVSTETLEDQRRQQNNQ